MRWYSSNIKPNEIKRQMNKYLKPKNFIETLQFKQRKAKVYFIFQTQFLFKLTLQKVEVIREREVAIYFSAKLP